MKELLAAHTRSTKWNELDGLTLRGKLLPDGRKKKNYRRLSTAAVLFLQSGSQAGAMASAEVSLPPVVSRIFRTFGLSHVFWKVVRLWLLCSGPPWGARAKRSGDGDDLGEPIHLVVAFGSPSGRRYMAESSGDQHQRRRGRLRPRAFAAISRASPVRAACSR